MLPRPLAVLATISINMNENLLKLLKSKNPIAVAIGIVIVCGMVVWSAFAFTTKAVEYTDQFETKENHAKDIEQKVSEFKKDIRIAILENNKVLLDEWEKRVKP